MLHIIKKNFRNVCTVMFIQSTTLCKPATAWFTRAGSLSCEYECVGLSVNSASHAVVFIYSMRTHVPHQIAPRCQCTLEIKCFTLNYGSLQCGYECPWVSSIYHSTQTGHRKFHICRGSLQWNVYL